MGDLIKYQGHQAVIESVPLENLGKRFGTPLFVYSKSLLEERCKKIKNAFSSHPTTLCYAIKANHNLSLLKLIFSKGLGADVVSEGELKKALVAGAPAKRIVFSGVGKGLPEIGAGIKHQILSFQVESLSELKLLSEVATSKKRKISLSLRINPNIPVETNPYIATGLYETKFGLPENQIAEALNLIKQNNKLHLVGLSCHLGSQIFATEPFGQASQRLVDIANQLSLQKFKIRFLDLGGGFAVSYQKEKETRIEDYASAIQKPIKKTPYHLIVEPGRWLVAESGLILAKVIHTKENPHKRFIILDAAMTELIRPALYEAYHPIEPCRKKQGKKKRFDVVGPVCETGDFLGLERCLVPPEPGDYFWIGFAGAYASSMSSEYNLRPKAAEVLVSKSRATLIRKRARIEASWKNE